MCQRGNVSHDALGRRRGHLCLQVAVVRYDNLLSRTDALGNTAEFTWDEGGNLVAVRQPDGATSTMEYNELNLPVRSTGRPDGQVQLVVFHGRRRAVRLPDRDKIATLVPRELSGVAERVRPGQQVVVADDRHLETEVASPPAEGIVAYVAALAHRPLSREGPGRPTRTGHRGAVGCPRPEPDRRALRVGLDRVHQSAERAR